MLLPLDLETRLPFDQLTLAIIGAEKTGKSRLASTGRKGILFLDYDLRAESLSGIPGVYALKMIDPPLPQNQTVIPDTFDILTSLEKSKKLIDLRAANQQLFPKVDPSIEIKTLVFDSGSSLAKSSMNYILASSGDLRQTVTVGSFQTYSPKNYIGWVTDQNQVESILLRAMATGLDVIFIMHESAEEAETSTEKNPVFTGKISPYPVRYARILKRFNEVWRCELVPGTKNEDRGRYVPRIRVCADFNFNASTCLMLDPYEDPNIEKMIEKHMIRSKSVK